MIHITITDVFNSVENKKEMLWGAIEWELERLQNEYMRLFSDYISIPYSQKLYEDLMIDFDQRIEKKKWEKESASKSEKQFIEQSIENLKNQKLWFKDKMEDLQRKEDNFIKWKAYFEELLSCWNTL